MQTKKRSLFDAVHKHITKKHISLIVGAHQVGKTTLMKQLEIRPNKAIL